MTVAILSCMDNRLAVERSVGLHEGDAFVLRNAGGRVTDDVLRSLTIACSVIGVNRILVVHHSDCRALAVKDDQLRERLRSQLGQDPGPIAFLGHPDLKKSVQVDMRAIKRCPTIPKGTRVEGFTYDMATHRSHPLNAEAAAVEVPSKRPPRTAPHGFRSHDGRSW